MSAAAGPRGEQRAQQARPDVSATRCHANLGGGDTNAIAADDAGKLRGIRHAVKYHLAFPAMLRKCLQVPAHQTRNRQAGIGMASEHLLDRVEDAVVDALGKGDMQRTGGLDIMEREHEARFQQRDRNLGAMPGREGQGIWPQNRTGPLPGQGRCYLLLADESESLKPFADSAAPGTALCLKRYLQLFYRELLAGEQQQSKRNAMGSRRGLRAERSRRVASVRARSRH